MAERKYVNRKKLDITAGKLPGSFRVVRDSTSDHSRIMDMLRKQANIKKSFTEGFSREDVIDAIVETRLQEVVANKQQERLDRIDRQSRGKATPLDRVSGFLDRTKKFGRMY